MFQILAQHSLSVEIKKSTFIATCLPISSTDDVARVLETLRQPNATHNCWAYRIGNAYRFNDDGEPGGSAGRPMLAAIDGQQFDGVLAHVVRYFGGIKLGVGGLVRAYGNTVAECLRSAPKAEIVPKKAFSIEMGFADSYAVYGLMHSMNIAKINESYSDTGIILELSVPNADYNEIYRRLIDATAGRIRILSDNE